MTNFEPQYPQQSQGYPPSQQPGYQQSGYPQQPYGPPQPGYQQPGYGPPYGQPRPTNTMAILALIFAFVFAPLGVVFGFIARGQIARTHEEGNGLALAGIIVGLVFTAILVLYIIFAIIFIGAAVDTVNDIEFDFPTPT
ncbi:MAG: DUF4190 domain-containing protein [Actinomycetota bacterium]|nr:DUF4190 domain-containing protein [Actinomycetota bacterium]